MPGDDQSGSVSVWRRVMECDHVHEDAGSVYRGDAWVAGGKPRIAGHRITVQDIAIWHERLGKSPDEIAAEYNLSLAAVYAALAYYFDHRAEIDRTIEEGQAFAEAVRQRNAIQASPKASGAATRVARRLASTPSGAGAG